MKPTGIKIPYIVTIEDSSSKVVGIRRNYEKYDEKKLKKRYFVHYKFLPGLGFYGFGLIHLIGSLSRTATKILRQLIDAGTLSNLPAGLSHEDLKLETMQSLSNQENLETLMHRMVTYEMLLCLYLTKNPLRPYTAY
jgi:hypothetical protein